MKWIKYFYYRLSGYIGKYEGHDIYVRYNKVIIKTNNKNEAYDFINSLITLSAKK